MGDLLCEVRRTDKRSKTMDANYYELNCRICPGQEINSHIHKDSDEHRFNFARLQYEKYRKKLLRDRHGIVIEAKPQLVNSLKADFEYVEGKGKYIIKIITEELLLNSRQITFQCSIQNNTRDTIYLTSVNLIHPSENFRIIYNPKVNFRYGLDNVLAVPSGDSYNFDVQFSTRDITTSSFLIPLICNFQTIKDKCFTIPRAFLVVITDSKQENKRSGKSPFTCQQWTNVRIIEPRQNIHYAVNYQIPEQYQRLLKFGLEDIPYITATEESTLVWLQTRMGDRVTEQNYAEYWHVTLWLEEVAETLMVQKYNMENVTLGIKQQDIIVLEVPGLSEKRPSVIVGDMIDIRVHEDDTAYRGIVKRVNEETVDIFYVAHKFVNYIKENPSTLVDVAFTLNRLSFQRMHEGVHNVVLSMLPAVFPWPSNLRNYKPNSSNIEFYNKEVESNKEQKNAVMHIINNNQQVAPYIVFGPPGTGKTVTVVEAILQIKKTTDKRILVCAPANSACDNIAIMLLPHCTTSELIRIHSDTRDRTTLTEQLKKYSNINEEGTFTKVDLSKVMTYRIIITTLVLIGRYRNFKPDCVFIDEAAQAREPEANIAIGFLEAGRQVVLAGDPKQLGPMVLSKCAEKYGLGISLMERLMEFDMYKPRYDGGFDSNYITMLKQNFRSHPLILDIPNKLFYYNQLIARSLKALNDPIVKVAVFRETQHHRSKRNKVHPGCAIEFCSVGAKERKEGSSPSYYNTEEVQMVLKYVKALVNLKLAERDKVQLDQIGVITPYKRQVYKIKDALKSNGFGEVEVGTTETYQGREKRIIIISTVRAQHSLLLHDRKYNLGFVRHEKRFNVAVTRAISKLIVIGCQVVLSTDSKWQAFIQMCKNYGTYFGAPYVERTSEWKGEVVNRMRHFKAKDDQYPTQRK